MITAKYTFVAGRYHATPWNRHVNEGHVEWPPSPLRLIRALLATGFRHLGWTALPQQAQDLLGALCQVLPSYHLPAATMAHTRHYLPINEGRTQKTSLAFDTWLNVDGPLYVFWDVELPPEQRVLLAELLRAQPYLGRAESWLEAELLDAAPVAPNSRPQEGGGLDSATVLAPLTPDQYADWRQANAPAPLEGKTTAKQRKEWEKAQAPYPRDLWDALLLDTSTWKKLGWSRPPGTKWVDYSVPKLTVDAAPATARYRTDARSDVLLFALGTPARSKSALPTVDRTVAQAELVHRSLVAAAHRVHGAASAVFSGKDASGAPLQGHRHAHILPVDTDKDGHIDHVLLWAPMGLSAGDVAAAHTVRRTWSKGGSYDIHVAVAGHGTLDTWRTTAPLLRPWCGASTTWVSATPFVPARHIKKRGADTIEGQVRRELAVRGLPEPTAVAYSPYPPEGAPVPPQWKSRFRHFVRRRTRSAVVPPQDVGFYLTVTFDQAVAGPLCLGYGSHFGLGLLVASPHD